jgi:hypothetical protein
VVLTRAGVFLLLEPAFELFGSMSGSIIKDEDHTE